MDLEVEDSLEIRNTKMYIFKEQKEPPEVFYKRNWFIKNIKGFLLAKSCCIEEVTTKQIRRKLQIRSHLLKVSLTQFVPLVFFCISPT